MSVDERWHGTIGGYSNHACRCMECRAANAAALREFRRRKRRSITPEHVHGTENGYGNYGCRCDACTDAWSRGCRERVQRRRERLAAGGAL